MKMLYSGPCKWAEGLLFDPYYDDRNAIAIMIDVAWPRDQRLFEKLVKWIQSHVPSYSKEITTNEAVTLWNNMTA